MDLHRSHQQIAGALVAAALLLCSPAQASKWLENVGVLVQVAGKPSGAAQVYDSDDYQRMLLVMEGRPIAAILDLAATTVYGVPRDSVLELHNGCVSTGDIQGEFLTLLDQNEGTLEFEWEEQLVRIEPLPPMIGETSLETVLALKPSYAKMAEEYEPDSVKTALLKDVGTDTEIRVYFGSWCYICKRLVPPLIGTLERVGNPKIRALYIGVDEDLTEPEREIVKYALEATPTIIILQGGLEIGRIEEAASSTIEGDLAEILGKR